jgi:hypothetical protein
MCFDRGMEQVLRGCFNSTFPDGINFIIPDTTIWQTTALDWREKRKLISHLSTFVGTQFDKFESYL